MKRFLPLALIILAACLVRAIGVTYGLPFAYHDDEPIIINYALAYGAGDFNPHVFNMSPFLSYALFFFYASMFLVGKVIGAFHSTADLAYLYLRDPTIFYLIARLVFGVMAGTASCVGIYFLAKKYFDRLTGLIAAFLLAFNFLHARDSHYAYFDVPLTLCVIIFFIKLRDLFLKKRTRDYIALGIILGLAISIKYSGIFLIVPLMLVFLVDIITPKDRGLGSKITRIAFCGTAAIVICFLSNPFAFLNWQKFLYDVTHLPFIPIPANFHFKISLLQGCGFFLTLAGMIGMALSLFSKHPLRAALTVYALLYYVVIARSSQPAERLILPIVPVIIVFASALIAQIAGYIRKYQWRWIAICALACVLIAPSLERIVRADYLFLQVDSRTESYNWIKKNIPKDSVVALDAIASWFPKLEKNKAQLKELLEVPTAAIFAKPKSSQERKARFLLDSPYYPDTTYFLYYLKDEPGADFLSAQPALTANIRDLRAKHIKYVVVSRMLIDQTHKDFIEEIEKNGVLLKEFSPYRQGRDPTINKEAMLPPAAGFLLAELKDRSRFGPYIKIYELHYE